MKFDFHRIKKKTEGDGESIVSLFSLHGLYRG
jgi:hypothetical protein